MSFVLCIYTAIIYSHEWCMQRVLIVYKTSWNKSIDRMTPWTEKGIRGAKEQDWEQQVQVHSSTKEPARERGCPALSPPWEQQWELGELTPRPPLEHPLCRAPSQHTGATVPSHQWQGGSRLAGQAQSHTNVNSNAQWVSRNTSQYLWENRSTNNPYITANYSDKNKSKHIWQ